MAPGILRSDTQPCKYVWPPFLSCIRNKEQYASWLSHMTSYCTISITLAGFLHLVWSLFSEEEHTHICILQCWFWYHRYTVVFSMREHMENRNVTFQQCPPPARKCTVNTTSSDRSDDICRTVNGTEQVGSWHYSIYLSLPHWGNGPG